MEANDHSWVGKTLNDRYELVREIGEGAMGTVYAGRRIDDGKQFAVKFLRPDLASQEQFAIRFEREARAQTRLKHPNIVGAFESGDLPNGGAFLVMQLVRGRDLKQMIEEEGPMSWRRACTIGVQVADALAMAHEAGIIHRDLKLANIMVEKSTRGRERALVLDFGLASLYQSDGSDGMEKLTVAGYVVGSPGYVAPEQLTGSGYDHTVDLYALGVIMWECIAGERLWKASSPMDTLLRQLKERPRGLPKDKEVPDGLRKLIRRLLAKDAARRPQSSADVRNELGQILMGMGPGAEDSRTGRRQRVPQAVEDDQRTTAYRPVEHGARAGASTSRRHAVVDVQELSDRSNRRSISSGVRSVDARHPSSSQSMQSIIDHYEDAPSRLLPLIAVVIVGAFLITLVVLGVL